MRGAAAEISSLNRVKSSYSSAVTRSEAVRISCSRSLSSWVMYRSALARVCLRT